MPAVNNQLIGWLAKPLAGVRCLLRFRHHIKCWRCQQNGHGNWLCSCLPADCAGGLMKNGAAFISLIWHRSSGRRLCVAYSLSWATREEKRDKMTTLCLSSKSSGGIKVFQIKLEILPWQLQTMSLFCCKSPQLPSGTGRSELMGLSTPWEVAAAVIGEGNLMTQITGCQVRGPEVMFYYLKMGHFYLFPPSLFPSTESTRCPHLRSHCCTHTWTWVDLSALSHPDGEGRGESSGSPLELCLPSLSFWRRAGTRKQNRRDAGLLQTLVCTNLRHMHHAIE